MLALGIRYLSGYVAASEHDAHERVEWPPHPARVFMALAAAHFETGAEPKEREALLWLEAQTEAPAIRAGDCHERTVVTQYVPVNDKAGPSKALLQSAPLTRERQARTFARAFLDDDSVYLIWADADPPAPTLRALVGLCAKVTRVGHSASLVQAWVAEADEVPDSNWVPADAAATAHLRVPTAGTLAELERRFNKEAVEEFAQLKVAASDDTDPKAQRQARRRLREEHPKGAPSRLRPQGSTYQGYAPVTDLVETEAVAGSVFSPHPLVLTLEREDGPQAHLDLQCAPVVVQRWREAILSFSSDLPAHARELLSGHDPGGKPMEGPHLAFLPMGFVGHEHADGRLLGMGLVLPGDLGTDDRRLVLQAVAQVRSLKLGRLGAWKVATERSGRPAWNLRSETWTAHPAGDTHWSTVTPVVFDRHPKAKDRARYQAEVAAMVAKGCTRIGLPAPREVIVTPVSAHPGVPPAHVFPRLRRKDGGERRHAHVIVVFGERVRGPVLVGAGRYRGYGVLRPLGGAA